MCYHPIHGSESHEETFVEMWNSCMYYIEQILEGAWLKTVLTTLSLWFLEFLHGDLHVLYIYLGVSFVDLFLGRKLAKKLGLYDRRKMKFWARKQFTHFTLVVLFGMVGHATFRTSGYDASIANWILLFLTYVEAASIEEKLNDLGYPVHPLLHKLFRIMRKKTVYDFSRLVDDPETREELEKALRTHMEKNLEERR